MDEIEKLARDHGTGGWQTLSDMVTFGKAVQLAERRRCAELVANANAYRGGHGEPPMLSTSQIVERILKDQ